MSYVNTTLGPIHGDEMGVTACHEHILWGPSGWEYDLSGGSIIPGYLKSVWKS